MVDFGKSDKMMKICRKVDTLNTYNGFNIYISFFIHRRISSDKTFSACFALERLDKVMENVCK